MTPWPRAKGAILLALAVLPLGGWYVQKGREPGLLTAAVSRKTLVRDVTLAGTIWPRHRHDAWPESSGRVERVFVAPNQRVSEGSPLFAVHCDAQRFELSRKELALSRLDVAAGAVEGLTPATDRRLAELEARHAREAVRSCLVASPHTGRVVHVGVEVGDYVGPNQSSQLPPVMLARDEGLLVRIEADEEEAKGVSEGASARVLLSHGVSELSGRVKGRPTLRRLGTGLGSAIYTVSVEIDQPAVRVPIGSTARVTIVTEERPDSLVVPVTAVFSMNGQDFVLLRSDWGFRLTKVQVGIARFDFVEVRAGVSEGQRVAVGDELALREAGGVGDAIK